MRIKICRTLIFIQCFFAQFSKLSLYLELSYFIFSSGCGVRTGVQLVLTMVSTSTEIGTITGQVTVIFIKGINIQPKYLFYNMRFLTQWLEPVQILHQIHMQAQGLSPNQKPEIYPPSSDRLETELIFTYPSIPSVSY